MTLNDMLANLKRCMEPYLDSLMKILLKRAALDTNTFISEEADKALMTMCFYCQDQKVLRSLLSCTNGGNHKSNLVR